MKQKMFASQIQNGFWAQNLPVVPKVNNCMALKRCQIVAKLSRVPSCLKSNYGDGIFNICVGLDDISAEPHTPSTHTHT